MVLVTVLIEDPIGNTKRRREICFQRGGLALTSVFGGDQILSNPDQIRQDLLAARGTCVSKTVPFAFEHEGMCVIM